MSVLVLAIVVAVTASSAIGRTRSTGAQAPDPTLTPCTAGRCALSSTSRASSISVVPTEVPAGSSPSFTAPTSNPAQGMLHGQRVTGVLDCSGYEPTDTGAYQFFLGGTFRGNVIYKVTYTVATTKSPAKLQFCLGATFKFTTSSGKTSKAVQLPNGISGFVGLLPSCKRVPKGPCLVSKASGGNGQGVVLKLLIRAVGGEDPWGRA
ncbi:MAG: hypothetical protein ACXVUL_21880 [Solirubrobacteraceae bacterium]